MKLVSVNGLQEKSSRKKTTLKHLCNQKMDCMSRSPHIVISNALTEMANTNNFI